nr:MAG TPA: hypothetical protein [Caudoviricetes sp.]
MTFSGNLLQLETLELRLGGSREADGQRREGRLPTGQLVQRQP